MPKKEPEVRVGEPPESTSAIVRQLALERGVNERTVWRWRARLRTEGRDSAFAQLFSERRCLHCGKVLPEGSTMGRRYCPGSACRVAVFRGRRSRA